MFEGLLFSDPKSLAKGLYRRDLERQLTDIRNEFNSPEEINDGVNTAPSKRLITLFPEYRKPLYGALAAMEIGIDAMRSQCKHFREWLAQLSS